jgi:hypothetical protein
VHQLSNIIAAPPHLHEPRLRHGSQPVGAIGQPSVDGRIASYRSGQPEDILPTTKAAEIQRNATRSTIRHSRPSPALWRYGVCADGVRDHVFVAVRVQSHFPDDQDSADFE